MFKKLLGIAALSVLMSQAFAATDYPTDYTKCAKEGETCTMTGTRSVAFGKAGSFVYATLSGSFTCSASLFPTSSVTGTRYCSYANSASATATPTPTTAATATPTPTTAATATPTTVTATATPTPTTVAATATPTPTSVSTSSTTAPGVRTVPSCTKVTVTATTTVASGEVWDGLVKYGTWVCLVGSGTSFDGTQAEDQLPIFSIAGGTVQNVIIGDGTVGTGTNLAAGGADGIHCTSGTCNVKNVYWADVGEDGATLKGSGNLTISGGAAFKAADKLFQHNGSGTLTIKDFYASNIGKMARSCGNCKTQYPRTIVLDGVSLGTVNVAIVGINSSYDSKSGIEGKYDTATFSNLDYSGSKTKCKTYIGTGTGYEPSEDSSETNIARACIFK